MNFRMLKKKYRKMYGQNPPKWMKERLIKTMVSPSEYREIKAIGIKTNFMKVIRRIWLMLPGFYLKGEKCRNENQITE